MDEVSNVDEQGHGRGGFIPYDRTSHASSPTIKPYRFIANSYQMTWTKLFQDYFKLNIVYTLLRIVDSRVHYIRLDYITFHRIRDFKFLLPLSKLGGFEYFRPANGRIHP